ncbi:MAG: Uncharacterised protein [Cellulomonadaceae bacterium TMED98]|nr:MAG: Uncharacterised protein [Cellulomonadaceae bacterium TMED98]
MVALFSLTPGQSTVIIQPVIVSAWRSGSITGSRNSGLPIENSLISRSNDHGVTGCRTRVIQRVIETQGGESIGEVSHRLIVIKVCLLDKFLRGLSPHPKQHAIGSPLTKNLESSVVHGPRPAHHSSRLDRGLLDRRPGLGNNLRHLIAPLLQPFPAHRTDREHTKTAICKLLGHHLGKLFGFWNIHFVQHHERWSVLKGNTLTGKLVARELGDDRVVVADWVAAGVIGGRVDHVDENVTALHVSQKLETQAFAFAGSFDEPRHIGDGVAHLTRFHDTEIGLQCGERIVRNFGLCLRHRGHQR